MFAIRAERAGRTHKTPDYTLLASMARMWSFANLHFDSFEKRRNTCVNVGSLLCELDLIDQNQRANGPN